LGAAARAFPGEAVSGDLHLVKAFNHTVLLAAVDGVGHGEEATAAARLAVRILECHAEEPPTELISRCHVGLLATRGVVMTVASLDPGQNQLAWAGVGNVEVRLVRAGANADAAMERAVLRNGLVGYKLPELREQAISIAPKDLLVFATDGVGPDFAHGWARSASPRQIAEGIMERHFKGTDDALVLVVRYLGSTHTHE